MAVYTWNSRTQEAEKADQEFEVVFEFKVILGYIRFNFSLFSPLPTKGMN